MDWYQNIPGIWEQFARHIGHEKTINYKQQDYIIPGAPASN